jgi:hypothetical protein
MVAIVCLSASHAGLLFRPRPFKVMSNHDTMTLRVMTLALALMCTGNAQNLRKYCCIEYASAREQVSDLHSAEEKKNHIVEVSAELLSVTVLNCYILLYPSSLTVSITCTVTTPQYLG